MDHLPIDEEAPRDPLQALEVLPVKTGNIVAPNSGVPSVHAGKALGVTLKQAFYNAKKDKET